MAYTALFTLNIAESHWEEFVPMLQINVEKSRLEPGCLSFDAHVAADAPRQVLLIEKYRDRAAFVVHCDDPRVQAHLAATAHMVEGEVGSSYWSDLD